MRPNSISIYLSKSSDSSIFCTESDVTRRYALAAKHSTSTSFCDLLSFVFIISVLFSWVPRIIELRYHILLTSCLMERIAAKSTAFNFSNYCWDAICSYTAYEGIERLLCPVCSQHPARIGSRQSQFRSMPTNIGIWWGIWNKLRCNPY